MGELIQFRLENEPNSSSGMNIFLPPNCTWMNLNDLIHIRFDLQNEHILEVLIVDKKTKQILGNILPKDQNINIPFTAYCVVKLKSKGAKNDGIQQNKITKNQLPPSPIHKIPVTPIAKNNSAMKPVATMKPSPIVAPSSSTSPSFSPSPTMIVSKLPQLDSEDGDGDDDDSGNSLLHDSCMLGQVQYVTALMKTKIDLEILNNKKQTPLMLACLYGHLEIVKLLVNSGANVFAEDENWSSAIHFAALHGDVKLIDWLLTEGNQDPSLENRFGQTPEAIVRLYHHDEAIRYFSKESKETTVCEVPPPPPYAVAAPAPSSRSHGTGKQSSPVGVMTKKERKVEEVAVVETEEKVLAEEWEEEEEEWEEKVDKDEPNRRVGDGVEDEDEEDEDQTEVAPQRIDSQPVSAPAAAPTVPSAENMSHSESLFLQACLHGDESAMMEFLRHGGDVHCCNENGSQGIHYLAAQGDITLLQLLLNYGALVDAVNKSHCTPLHFACQNGHVAMIQWLISQRNCNVFIENSNGLTPIHVLCGTSTAEGYEALTWFIEQQPLYFNEFIQQNQLSPYPHIKSLLTSTITLLHVSCTSSNPHIIACLLDHGFDLTLRDEKSHNILHIACNENNLEAVKLICAHASASSTSAGGSLVDQLLNMPADETNITPVFYACLIGSYPIVKYLNKFSPDYTIRNVRGNSCVHAACQNGNVKLVKYLLKKGCPVQTVNKTGYWPLDFALQTHQEGLINYLREIHAMSSEGYRQLIDSCLCHEMSAIQRWVSEGEERELIPCLTLLGYEDKVTIPQEVVLISILHLLCYHGVDDAFRVFINTFTGEELDLEVRDAYDRTPLHFLAMTKTTSEPAALRILDTILSSSRGLTIDLDPIDAMGFTPFFYACQHNNLLLAQRLINLGSNLYHTGGHEDKLTTALHLSTAHGHLSIVQWLTESGLSLSAMNENENTPVDIAKFEGHQEIYRWFITTGLSLQEQRLTQTLVPQMLWTLESHHFKFATSVLKEMIDLLNARGGGDNEEEEEGEEVGQWVCEVDGSTLLHYACGCGDVESTRLLVEHYHCDPLVVNHTGHTPFHVACIYGHVEVVMFLHTHCQIKMTLKDSDGNSGFHHACLHNQLEVVRYYGQQQQHQPRLSRGHGHGLINMINNHSDHGLHLACLAGHLAVVEVLVREYHINVNCLNDDKMTPLHVACYSQWDDIIVTLIQTHECKFELEDKNQMTVSDLIPLLKYEPLTRWFQTICETGAGKGGGGVVYEPSTPFNNRGKKLRLPTDEIMSESESEDNHQSHHSKPEIYEHLVTTGGGGGGGGSTFLPSSFFFCVSDTATAPSSSAFMDPPPATQDKRSPLYLDNESDDEHNDDDDDGDQDHVGDQNGDDDNDHGPLSSVSAHPSDETAIMHQALFESIEKKNMELFTHLFDENCEWIDFNYRQPTTLNNLFHLIATQQHIEMLQYVMTFLSTSGHEVVSSATQALNAKNSFSFTPLHIVCEATHQPAGGEMILYLLTQCQVDINIPNNTSHTPFTVLILKKNISILKEILNLAQQRTPALFPPLNLSHLSNTDQTYFHHAISTKSFEVIELISLIFELATSSPSLSSSAPGLDGNDVCGGVVEDYMNYPDHEGKSPLHYACQFCSYNIITFLLSNSADISLTDHHSCPPVYYAVIAGNLKIIQLLLEKYSNISCLNDHGDSLLHVACYHGRLVVAKWLVGKGLDMNLMNREGLTPIDYSEQSSNKGVIEWAKTFN
jgi:ankyrin repeat protein